MVNKSAYNDNETKRMNNMFGGSPGHSQKVRQIWNVWKVCLDINHDHPKVWKVWTVWKVWL